VFKPLLALLTFAACWSASHEAFAQALRTAAFIDVVKFSAKATQAHDRFRAALEEALSPKNWFLVQTGRPIPDCGAAPDCMAKVAGDFSTNYVLRIAGQKSQEYGYEISLDAYSKSAGLSRSSFASCDICDSERLAELAGKSAVELLAGLLKDEAMLREKAKQVTPTPVAVPAPNPPPRAEIVTPPKVVELATHAWIPWALIGTGAVAVGYGAWALAKNGDSAGSWSLASGEVGRDYYGPKIVGVVSLLGGGALAATGLIWVLTSSTQTTTVLASPQHVAINVRF
jgi:hypothetical protein